MTHIYGIHHVSSIVKHAQENIDFYAGLFGLRLVKQTLNYDDVKDYHFYFGNQDASSNLATFFPMVDADEGREGLGQVGYVTYAIPNNSFVFWEQRLKHFNVPYFYIERFGTRYLAFNDSHGLAVELVETNLGASNTWHFNGVDTDHAINGIHNAALYSSNPDATHDLLTRIFGYKLNVEDDEIAQYSVNDHLGGMIELRKKRGSIGKRGYGNVHHIALAVDDDALEDWRQKLIDEGFEPTEIRERKYFRSIYFRERGGVLFELATLSPGMTVDETVETLGEALIIPDHYMDKKEEIIARMMPVHVKPVDTLETYSYRNKDEYEIIEKRRKIIESIQELKKIDEPTEQEQKTLSDLRKAFIAVGKGQ